MVILYPRLIIVKYHKNNLFVGLTWKQPHWWIFSILYALASNKRWKDKHDGMNLAVFHNSDLILHAFTETFGIIYR